MGWPCCFLARHVCAPAVQSELQAKALLAEKLQELARSLQAQNKQMKEEDLLKRQNMLGDFQSAIDDIKSRHARPLGLRLLTCSNDFTY